MDNNTGCKNCDEVNVGAENIQVQKTLSNSLMCSIVIDVQETEVLNLYS